MSQNDPTTLLQRILGEEADALMHMLREQSADEALLQSHGIDTEAMLERAKAQISRAGKLTKHGINPPIPLEELTDAQFEALDIPTLEKYLAAGDVDVQRLLTCTKQLLEDAKPQPAPGFFARISARLPRWPSAPVAGLAVSAMALTPLTRRRPWVATTAWPASTGMPASRARCRSSPVVSGRRSMTASTATPAALTASTRAGVKCSPAVGAATAPGLSANSVW